MQTHLSCLKYLYQYHATFTRPAASYPLHHSTVTAMLDVLDDIYWAMNGGSGSGLVFLDLRKAFDTVDHGILLGKLSEMNFDANSLGWFNSYLNNRFQCTKVNNTVSQKERILCGVPQGSILGPLLFIIYMNNLNLVLNFCNVALYADDTVIWAKGRNIFEIQDKLQQDLLNVTDWLCDNKLSINATKCKSMLISSPHHPIRNLELSVRINDCILECVSSYKYLGVYLDSTLTFNQHIESLTKKVSKRLGVIAVARKYMSCKQCNILYKSLVLPIIDFGDLIYMETSRANLDAIQTLQNRACRIILRVPSDTPTLTMHENLKLMYLVKRRKFHLQYFTYKAVHSLLPGYISDKIKVKQYDTEIQIRAASSGQLEVPRCRLVKTESAFSVKCPLNYNLLPQHLRESATVNSFRSGYFRLYGYL